MLIVRNIVLVCKRCSSVLMNNMTKIIKGLLEYFSVFRVATICLFTNLTGCLTSRMSLRSLATPPSTRPSYSRRRRLTLSAQHEVGKNPVAFKER